MKKAGNYKEGAQNRQKVLDYLHENPGALAQMIYAHLGVHRNVGGTKLLAMCDLNEVRREPAMYEYTDANGKVISVPSFAYFALVRKTLNYDPDYKPGGKGDAPPWVTRSCDIRDPYTSSPYPNQGGQGSYGPRSICSLEYV